MSFDDIVICHLGIVKGVFNGVQPPPPDIFRLFLIRRILYFRHLSIYTIKHNYKKYIHTIKNKYITCKNNY